MKSTRFSQTQGASWDLPDVWGAVRVDGVGGRFAAGDACAGLVRSGVSVLGRSLQAWVVGRGCRAEAAIGLAMILFPVRDLMGILFWALSYGNNRILWRGEVYELVRGVGGMDEG